MRLPFLNTRTTDWACALGAFLLLTAGFVLAEEVNQPAPELEIKMENGQIVKLSQFKGKPLVLEFFSTTCPHCQKSAESLEKTLRAYSAKGSSNFIV